jgi:PIN domain nuclease of toxin-antitoxin system
MRLLLDTHIMLALIEHRMARLSADIEALLRDPDNEHRLSTASLWKIAIKSRLGKLPQIEPKCFASDSPAEPAAL